MTRQRWTCGDPVDVTQRMQPGRGDQDSKTKAREVQVGGADADGFAQLEVERYHNII